VKNINMLSDQNAELLIVKEGSTTSSRSYNFKVHLGD
jgi:hypothetical protein